MPNRRQIIALAAAAGMLAAAPAAAQSTPVTVALDWTPNTNHIGLYVAQAKGFYADAGLDVDILPYSDTSAGTLIANGVADFGIVGTISVYAKRSAGADLVATYAVVQTETGRLVFNDERTEIQRPRDLDGLTYGGFGSEWENALIASMIQHDGGQGTFETVTLGTSAYEALANGAIDFTLEVYTWEGVKAELDGDPQRAFRYADFGVPDQHTTFIGSSQAYLDANPATATAFIQATKAGYAYTIEHPEDAADIIIAANPDALTDRDFILASLKTMIEGHYLATEDGVIGTIDSVKMEALGDYMLGAGILKDVNGDVVTTRPDFSAYYTNAYVDVAQ